MTYQARDELLARLISECCRCSRCGYIQAAPNWCQKCGHRVELPDWASILFGEMESLIRERDELQEHLDTITDRVLSLIEKP